MDYNNNHGVHPESKNEKWSNGSSNCLQSKRQDFQDN